MPEGCLAAPAYEEYDAVDVNLAVTDEGYFDTMFGEID
jgi:hypothetical protein